MKFKLWVSLLVGAVLILGACQAASPAGSAAADQPRTINVEGTGQVSLEPSLVRISIGVQTEDDNAQEAVNANNEQIAQVMAALDSYDIPDEDIQTTQFSIRQQEGREPVKEVQPGSQGGYVVSNLVRVTLRDIDQLGNLLDDVIEAGANSIENIQFDAENKEQANKQALELAMKDARARAQAIADSAGVELGEVYRVETFGGGPVYAEERMEAEGGAAAVPISPGQLDIQVRVNVSYQILR